MPDVPETRSILVALSHDVTEEEQLELAEELRERDDVVDVKDMVITGYPDDADE